MLLISLYHLCFLLLFRSVGPQAAQPRKKAENESRCQACWLKLCLLGYNLEADLYNKLRGRLPIVFHDLLPDDSDRISKTSNRGEILQFEQKATPLSRPLFEGFGEVPKSEEPSIVSPKNKENKVKAPVVIERLPNGWSKKAVKRRGKWETVLVTPDQRTVKNQLELKLYIAKSGAVIDANLVNFSMPKRTAKMDKKLSNAIDAYLNTPLKVQSSCKSDTSSTPGSSTPGSSVKRTYQKKSVILVPRSSRRDVKLPQKYRQDEQEEQISPNKTIVPKLLKSSNIGKSNLKSKRRRKIRDSFSQFFVSHVNSQALAFSFNLR